MSKESDRKILSATLLGSYLWSLAGCVVDPVTPTPIAAKTIFPITSPVEIMTDATEEPLATETPEPTPTEPLVQIFPWDLLSDLRPVRQHLRGETSPAPSQTVISHFSETAPEKKIILPPGTIFSRLPVKNGLFFLTIDDQVEISVLNNYLSELDTLGIRATFFFPTDYILLLSKVAPGTLNRLLQKHDLGMHGKNHEAFSKITTLTEARNLYSQMRADYFKATGKQPWLERKPYGDLGNAEQARWLTEIIGPENNLVFAQWSLSLGDGAASIDSDYEISQMRILTPGTILLSHDTKKVTRDTLPVLMAIARSKGLESAKLSDIITISK